MGKRGGVSYDYDDLFMPHDSNLGGRSRVQVWCSNGASVPLASAR